jgi:O-acetyl-ADP-ribose deacetylase (regulator of RNase III)
MPSEEKMSNIRYVTGDATAPTGEGMKIIVHCCNDEGKWGRGFVLALSRRWAEPEAHYRLWARRLPGSDPPFALGNVQFVHVEQGICVANLIGQHGIYPAGGVPPVRYDALRQGLHTVAHTAMAMRASVHLPMLGAGLAGGDWAVIAGIIDDELCRYGNVPVTVYRLH